MKLMTITEYGWRNKVHKYHINTYNGIQWYVNNSMLIVTDYFTGKTLKKINMSNWSSCYIDVCDI